MLAIELSSPVFLIRDLDLSFQSENYYRETMRGSAKNGSTMKNDTITNVVLSGLDHQFQGKNACHRLAVPAYLSTPVVELLLLFLMGLVGRSFVQSFVQTVQSFIAIWYGSSLTH